MFLAKQESRVIFRKFKKSIHNILIVEDEPLVAFENELLVQGAGYRVIDTVDTEEEAIALIDKGDIQLVLSDVMLADGGDGVNVAKYASQHDIPVLFASGSCPINARQFAIGCLVKPYNERDLLKAIHAVDMLIQGKAVNKMPQSLMLYEE